VLNNVHLKKNSVLCETTCIHSYLDNNCRSVSAGEVGDLWAVLDSYEGVGGVVVRRRGINPASPGGDEWEPCVGGGWKQITVRGRIK
jgi:hypothetical protein